METLSTSVTFTEEALPQTGFYTPTATATPAAKPIFKKNRDTLAMTALKLFILLLVGGTVYGGVEILYRGNTHPSMFIVGGLCFVLIGLINEIFTYDMPLLLQMLVSSLIITVIEFVSGVIVNLWLSLDVWDYSAIPFNVLGQICLRFSVYWFFLSIVGILLDDFLRWKMFNEEKPKYKLI